MIKKSLKRIWYFICIFIYLIYIYIIEIAPDSIFKIDIYLIYLSLRELLSF